MIAVIAVAAGAFVASTYLLGDHYAQRAPSEDSLTTDEAPLPRPPLEPDANLRRPVGVETGPTPSLPEVTDDNSVRAARSAQALQPESITIRAKGVGKPLATGETHDSQRDLEGPKQPLRHLVRKIELDLDAKGCEACWNATSRDIVVPRTCTYESHTVTQLSRQPYAPIAQSEDRFTAWTDYPDWDAAGRV